MEDNVALDSAKQKQFVKSVRGIKKLLKKKGTVPKKATKVTPKKDGVKKDGMIKKRKKRGLVYLSHIPHGFYEHEMTEYFKQFGVVTNARVIRSKRTGNSKGFAFVEFKEPTVAEIVADTMNNYLMGKRLIKAVYVPPAKQRHNAIRKNWNYQNNPLNQLRQNLRKQHNADKTDEEELKLARKMLSNLNKTKKKLSEIGIDYDFFNPVDVPMELTEEIEKKPVNNVDVKPKEEIEVKSVTKPKGAKEEVKSEPEVKENKGKNKKNKPAIAKVTQVVEEKKQPLLEKNTTKEHNKNVEGTKKQQKEKQAKLDKAGVKALEDFIKVKDDSNDESDSSVDFDSDEYEKMVENDNDSWSEEESDLKIDEDKKKVRLNNKRNKKTTPSTPKQQDKIPNKQSKQQNKKNNNKSVQLLKKQMLISLSETTSPKNAKFEKQNKKKPLNKVIKKKK